MTEEQFVGAYLSGWHGYFGFCHTSMLARGLVEILPTRAGWRAVFTEAGRATLRDMAQDRRALGPARLPRQRSERGLHQTNDADA